MNEWIIFTRNKTRNKYEVKKWLQQEWENISYNNISLKIKLKFIYFFVMKNENSMILRRIAIRAVICCKNICERKIKFHKVFFELRKNVISYPRK